MRWCQLGIVMLFVIGLGSISGEASSSTVTGFVYALSEKGDYEPLENVEIVAFRVGEGPVLKTPLRSTSGGHFSLQVPSGTPFTVVFYGDDRVPELQQLAATAGSKMQVEITLMTLKQFNGSHRGASAADRLQLIEGELPTDADGELASLRALIKRLKPTALQTPQPPINLRLVP